MKTLLRTADADDAAPQPGIGEGVGAAARLAMMNNLGILLRRARHTLVEQVDAKLKPFGITYALFAPLACLNRSGAMPTAALARELVIDSGALTRCLDRVMAMGMVCREYSPQDRRCVIVSLSGKGRQVVADLQHTLSEVVEANLVGISADEMQVVLDVMERIVANGKDRLGPDRNSGECSGSPGCSS